MNKGITPDVEAVLTVFQGGNGFAPAEHTVVRRRTAVETELGGERQVYDLLEVFEILSERVFP